MWRPRLAWTGSELIAIGKEASLILHPEPTAQMPDAIDDDVAYEVTRWNPDHP